MTPMLHLANTNAHFPGWICLGLLMLLSLSLPAQSSQGFSYQAVARDGSGQILANQALDVQFILHQEQQARIEALEARLVE